MDGKKKYGAFSIPRQEARPDKDAKPVNDAPAYTQLRFAEVDLSVAVPFAEIEYEPNAAGAPPPSPAQPVGPRTVDPIREKFFAMRSLVSGTPFARNDPALFYKQAKFMADFSDDYGGGARFFMYYPSYQHMGYEQLRTYFTWRAKARGGAFQPISLSYIFLYIYELLNGIGVKDPAEGLDKLLAVWNAYRERERALDNYLPGWLKDYHIYYTLPHSFADFVYGHGLQRHYLDLLLFDGDPESGFASWCGLSSYPIAKSKFFCAENEKLMKNCFSAVLGGISELLASRNFRVEHLLTRGMRRGTPWYPFGQALFYPWLDQDDRRVEMPGREIYSCANNRWTASFPVLDPDRREIVGYLMKKTEACLRREVNYKYKITANPGAFCNLPYKLGQLNTTLKELDAVIEKTVSDFYKDLNRTVVVVDHDRLRHIRQEALSTRDKLIVPEDEAPSAPVAMKAEEQRQVPQLSALESESSVPAYDGWAALKGALSATELKALSIILDGGADIRAFADENGVMLEVLADNINEKAADHIGDGIIEFADGMALYDEYRDNIAEIVAH